MKRLCILLLMLLSLAGCAAGSDTAQSAWQTELAGGGALAVSGCTVTETQAPLWLDQYTLCESLPLLELEGVPTLTFSGVDEADIALAYIEPAGVEWRVYEPYIPVEKLDYILTRAEDGMLRYRLDTVYGYLVTVEGEQWMLAVHRDGY